MGDLPNQKKDLLDEAEKEFFPSAKRDVFYSALVKDIVKNNRASQIMKYFFFGFVCAIFLFTCIVGMIVILNISKKKNVSIADIGVALTAFGAVLSSIIVLPSTIANHLFPADSEKTRFAFIRDNQQFDSAYILNNSNSIADEAEDELPDHYDEDSDETSAFSADNDQTFTNSNSPTNSEQNS